MVLMNISKINMKLKDLQKADHVEGFCTLMTIFVYKVGIREILLKVFNMQVCCF